MQAMFRTALGSKYIMGRGVPQSYAEALKWLRKAAEQGDTYGLKNLGNMAAYGFGMPRDYAVAHMYFMLAAELGDEEAAQLVQNQRKDMTPEQIEDAKRMADEWLVEHRPR